MREKTLRAESDLGGASCYYTFSPKGLFSDITYLKTIYLGWLLRARKPRGV